MKKLIYLLFVSLALAACGGKTADVKQTSVDSWQNWDYASISKNKPVLITSMAGFCGYCKKMAPLLDKLAGDYKGKNVEFVFAFVDEQPQGIREIVKNLSLKNATVLYNGSEFAQTMGVEGFPSIYLIDNTGDETILVEEWHGYDEEHIADIKAELDELLK
jgi:thiol-disulfide isomerase/thioredoxin